MIDKNLICWMIRDILTTDAYTLSGIAYYTETPEDVIYEIVIGQDIRPSAIFLTKIIELHKEVRQDLYQEIKRKITEEYLSAA